jgi:hypothetical protein
MVDNIKTDSENVNYNDDSLDLNHDESELLYLIAAFIVEIIIKETNAGK